MAEYGMVLMVWFEHGPLVLNHTGSSCYSILVEVLKIVGKGHEYVVLACDILVVV